MENDGRILEHIFKLFVKLNINTYTLNPLNYIGLPGYIFDRFLKLIECELDTIQYKQTLKEIVSAIRLIVVLW